MLRVDLGFQRSALEWPFFCSELPSCSTHWDAKGTSIRSHIVSLMVMGMEIGSMIMKLVDYRKQR